MGIKRKTPSPALSVTIAILLFTAVFTGTDAVLTAQVNTGIWFGVFSIENGQVTIAYRNPFFPRCLELVTSTGRMPVNVNQPLCSNEDVMTVPLDVFYLSVPQGKAWGNFRLCEEGKYRTKNCSAPLRATFAPFTLQTFTVDTTRNTVAIAYGNPLTPLCLHVTTSAAPRTAVYAEEALCAGGGRVELPLSAFSPSLLAKSKYRLCLENNYLSRFCTASMKPVFTGGQSSSSRPRSSSSSSSPTSTSLRPSFRQFEIVGPDFLLGYENPLDLDANGVPAACLHLVTDAQPRSPIALQYPLCGFGGAFHQSVYDLPASIRTEKFRLCDERSYANSRCSNAIKANQPLSEPQKKPTFDTFIIDQGTGKVRIQYSNPFMDPFLGCLILVDEQYKLETHVQEYFCKASDYVTKNESDFTRSLRSGKFHLCVRYDFASHPEYCSAAKKATLRP